jgi:hypothetical protein
LLGALIDRDQKTRAAIDQVFSFGEEAKNAKKTKPSARRMGAQKPSNIGQAAR